MTGNSKIWDAVVLGAGGAGMMCAATAARRGKSVALLDHAGVLGRKILISGGGRCNFTNIGAQALSYYSGNQHFAKSALARFTPNDFLALIEKHKVPYYEKKLGQLFCRDSAQRIVDLLKAECAEAGVSVFLNSQIRKVEALALNGAAHFKLVSEGGDIFAKKVVVATGGLSIPKIGATDFGYRIAEQFGLKVTRLDPALVSLTLPIEMLDLYRELSGVSLEAEVSAGGRSFIENVLFTHSGVSGPAILQASLFWKPSETIVIRWLPKLHWEDLLLKAKKEGLKRSLKNVIGEHTTDRFAEIYLKEFSADTPINQLADSALRVVAKKLSHWEIKPAGTGGYSKAEVTRGGVSTDELSSKNLEAKKMPGLYFIGEVVDVTGMLGGYNFQWAWASGVASGETI